MTIDKNDAVQKITDALAEQVKIDKEKLAAIVEQCLTLDMEYMVAAGVIADEQFTDAWYDDDNAYEYIADHLKADGVDEPAAMEIIDLYMEQFEDYMAQRDMLEWE